jgi:hypothetical protein
MVCYNTGICGAALAWISSGPPNGGAGIATSRRYPAHIGRENATAARNGRITWCHRHHMEVFMAITYDGPIIGPHPRPGVIGL